MHMHLSTCICMHLPWSRIHWFLNCSGLFAFPTLTLNHLKSELLFKQISNPMKEKKIDKAFVSKILWYCTLTLKLRGRIRKRWSRSKLCIDWSKNKNWLYRMLCLSLGSNKTRPKHYWFKIILEGVTHQK